MTEATSRLRLVIDSSDARRAADDFDKFGREADEAARSATRFEQGAKTAGQGANAAGAGARGLAVGVAAAGAALAAAALAARGFFEAVKAADDLRALENRLRLVTDSAQELADVQRAVFEISQETFNSLNGTTQIYQRFAQANEELGLSQRELVAATEAVAKAVALSGATAAGAEAAIIQFGQGLAAGQLRGEELNSVLEQTPRLAKALADGLGISIGQIRQFAAEGRITSDAIIAALEDQADELDAEFGRINKTFAQTAQQVKNAAATLASEALDPILDIKIEFWSGLADLLSSEEAVEAASNFGEALVEIDQIAKGIGDSIAEAIERLNAVRVGAVDALQSLTPPGQEGRPTTVGVAFTQIGNFVGDGFERLRQRGEEVEEIAEAQRRAAEVYEAGLEQVEARLERIADLGPQVAIPELSIMRAEDLGAALERGLSSAEKFAALNRTGAFIFRDPLGDDAINAFNPAVSPFTSDQLIVRTEKQADALRKVRKEAEEAAIKVAELFNTRVQRPFEDAARLFEVASSGGNVAAERERIEIEREVAELRAQGVTQSAEQLQNKIRETRELQRQVALIEQSQDLQAAFRAERERNAPLIDAARRGPDPLARDIDRELAERQDNERLRLEREIFRQGLDAARAEAARQELQRQQAEETRRFNEVVQGRLESFDGTLGQIERNTGALGDVEDVADTVGQISFAIDQGLQRAVDTIVQGGGFLDVAQGISGAIGDSARSIGEALSTAGERFNDKLFRNLGQALEAAGAVGQAISATIGVIRTIRQLFGSASSGATFGINGEVEFERRSVSPERNQSRNEIGQATVDLAEEIADLIGGSFSEGVGIRIFIDANDRLLASLRDLQTNAIIALPEGVTSDSQGNTGDPRVAIRQGVNLLIANALEGGNETLAAFARAAASADIETEDLVDGINALKNVLDLTAEPLSNVEQQLKAIDDAVAPAVAALERVGQSIDEITQIATQAARAVGEAFIRDIEQDILDFRNATLGDFKRILDDQKRLVEDAQALLDRGAITPEEFDLVQVRNSLERERFFEGLDAEELAQLGDFLGLIEESGGGVAVVLTQLQQAFADFVEGVEETRRELQSQADQLKAAARSIFETRDNILERFPRQSGGELLSELRAQLAGLRESALAGDNTAFEQIPDVANRFIDLARSILGSTEQFAKERDFALNILDQTGNLADARADKLLTEIEALNQQVDVLNDIREALESPDPAVDLIRAQLDQGGVTNDLLRQLLEQYIALTQEARAGSITPAEAQAASEGFFSVNNGSGAGTPVVSIDRFDDSLIILAEVRKAIIDGNNQTQAILNRIATEQRRAGANAALTG